MGRAIVFAEVANLAVTWIGDHRLGSDRIHADDVHGAGQNAEAAARAGIEIDGQLAADGSIHEGSTAACSRRMMAPIGPSVAATGGCGRNLAPWAGKPCRSKTTSPSPFKVAPCQQNHDGSVIGWSSRKNCSRLSL